MAVYREGRECEKCGHLFTIGIVCYGDYDGPDGLPTVESCEVCNSEPYKKLIELLKTAAEIIEERKIVSHYEETFDKWEHFPDQECVNWLSKYNGGEW